MYHMNFRCLFLSHFLCFLARFCVLKAHQIRFNKATKLVAGAATSSTNVVFYFNVVAIIYFCHQPLRIQGLMIQKYLNR